MKKLFYTITALLLSFGAGAQTIPNNDFEEWELDMSLFTGLDTKEPVDWNTNNFGDTTYFPESVTQSKDAYSGDYCVRLEVGEDGWPGEIDAEIPDIESDVDRYLNGYFKGSIDSTKDTFLVSVAYYNSVLDSFYIMGGFVKSAPEDWTAFSVDVNPNLDSDFDTAYILIWLSGKWKSYVKIDSVHFTGDTSGVQFSSTSKNPFFGSEDVTGIIKNEGPLYNVNVYPNPANSHARIGYNLIKSSAVNIEVFDFMGRKVETVISNQRQSGKQDILINTQNYKPGIYFIHINSGRYVVTKKLVVN